MSSPFRSRSRADAAGTLPDLPGVDHLLPDGDIPPLRERSRYRAEGATPRAALRAHRSKESVLDGCSRDMPTRRRPERQPSYYVDHGHPPPIPSQLPACARIPLAGLAAGDPPPAESLSPTLSETDIPLVTATTIPEREVAATAAPRSLFPTRHPSPGTTSPSLSLSLNSAPATPKHTSLRSKLGSSPLGSWFHAHLPTLRHHQHQPPSSPTTSRSHVVSASTLRAARRGNISGPSYDVVARYDNAAWDPRLKDAARVGGDVLAGEKRVPHPVFSQLRRRDEEEEERAREGGRSQS